LPPYSRVTENKIRRNALPGVDLDQNRWNAAAKSIQRCWFWWAFKINDLNRQNSGLLNQEIPSYWLSPCLLTLLLFA
jgi:hypothetical protein